MQLAADDLVPGMFVTVLDTEGKHEPQGPGGKPGKDYTAAGAVLRVISVSLPFVLVQNMTPGMLRGPRMFPVDLRRSRLSSISDEYVRAAIGDPPSIHEPISPIDAGVISREDDTPDTPAPGAREEGFGGGIYFLGGS